MVNQSDSRLIFPELSYQIMKLLFGVHNSLGNQLQEKTYQQAFAVRLKEHSLPFQRELYLPIQDKQTQVGKYYLDFVVDSKIAIELKAKPSLTNTDIRQLLAYPQVARLKLGILVNFRTLRPTYKRVVNPSVVLLQ